MPLHLIPNFINQEALNLSQDAAPNPLDLAKNVPIETQQAVAEMDGWIVENCKVARRFFRHFPSYKKLLTLPMELYNKHTTKKELQNILIPMKKGEHWGLLSDSGLPCIADPGNQLVKLARKEGVEVVPHIGPSSFFLILILSGLPTHSFTFHGYFPKTKETLQSLCTPQIASHLFIETPYRNEQTLEKLLEWLSPSTSLSIGIDLMGKEQQVLTMNIAKWKKEPSLQFRGKPAIFMISTPES